jgi:hypothetical protein
LGRKHGCKWSIHPETTDEYDLEMTRMARNFYVRTGCGSLVGAAQGEREGARDECTKELYG